MRISDWSSDVCSSDLLPAYDVSSVQVLKRPQGTLFVRNTTGGAVLVYSALATYALEGYIQGTLGNYDWRAVLGAFNIPIVADHIALRIAGDINKRDGYQTDAVVSGRSEAHTSEHQS